MTDPMLRATTWSSLRSAFHNARLDPRVAMDLVVAAPPLDDPDDNPRRPRNLAWVYRHVLPLQPDPPAARDRLGRVARDALAAADAGSERQLSALRVVVETSTDTDRLTAWRDERDLPGGVVPDVDLRWRLWTRLAVLGATDPDELDRALAADPTAAAQVAHTEARAALPTAEAKAWAWARFTGEADVANHEVDAAALGLWRPEQPELTEGYVDRYFDDLPATASVRSGWTLGAAAEQFFPWLSWQGSTIARADATAADRTLDPTLRRVLVEQADQLRRLAAVVAAYP